MRHALKLSMILAALALMGCGGSGAASTRATVPSGSPTANPAPSFQKSGMASYYGEKFRGRPTANGEKFDPAGLTAAHGSLPFNTRLRVTNTQNGRWVVVRINDRFGGHRDRVIDLSEGAFRKIANANQGVVPVRLEVVR